MWINQHNNIYLQGGASCRCGELYTYEECVRIFKEKGRLSCPRCGKDLRTRPHRRGEKHQYQPEYFFERARRMGIING